MNDLQEDIETRLAELDPSVELIALEQPAPDALRLYIDHPDGVDLGLCERVTEHAARPADDYSLEVSSPGAERPLTKPEHFRRFLGRTGARADPRGARGQQQLHRHDRPPPTRAASRCASPRATVTIPHERIRRSNLDSGGEQLMSKEIVDAIRALEQEKGIAADTLMDALEDALLSAYHKTPGAAKYARVDLDHETADFRVFELILPPELEEKLLEQAIDEQEPHDRPRDGRAARARGAASSTRR